MKKRKPILIVVYILVLVLAFSWMLGIFSNKDDGLAYSEILEQFDKENVRSFVVEDTVGQRETVAFDYNLIWEPGEETYTLATDRCTHTIQGSLLIRPRGNDNMPTQSLTLKIDFSSGSSQRAATQLNATLVWQDLDSEATITAALQSKTAAPFAVQALDQIGSSMRIDLMDGKTHSALLEYWSQRLGAWSEGLLKKLVPSLAPYLP